MHEPRDALRDEIKAEDGLNQLYLDHRQLMPHSHKIEAGIKNVEEKLAAAQDRYTRHCISPRELTPNLPYILLR